jgi:hypothetical protein
MAHNTRLQRHWRAAASFDQRLFLTVTILFVTMTILLLLPIGKWRVIVSILPATRSEASRSTAT